MLSFIAQILCFETLMLCKEVHFNLILFKALNIARSKPYKISEKCPTIR